MTIGRTFWVADSFVSGFFAVGWETGCDGGTRLMLWKVTDDGLQVVFSEDSILNTDGRHGVQLLNGSIVVVGISKRVTDLWHLEERQPDPDKYIRLGPSVSYSIKETNDLLILVLSPDAMVTERVVVPFGGDVHVNGLLKTDWGLSAYGGVAGQGAFIDLKLN